MQDYRLSNGTMRSDWSAETWCFTCDRSSHTSAICLKHDQCLTCCTGLPGSHPTEKGKKPVLKQFSEAARAQIAQDMKDLFTGE